MKKLTILFALSLLLTVSLPAYQLFKTALKLSVVDDLGNKVEGATVRLFNNLEDYKAEKNQVDETLQTDSKGQVYFKELKTKSYYVLIQKGDKNNWNGANILDTLQEKRVNKALIVIE